MISQESFEKVKLIALYIISFTNKLSHLVIVVILSFLGFKLLSNHLHIVRVYFDVFNEYLKNVIIWTMVFFLFFIACTLLYFKKKQQFWYGVLETIFSLTAAFVTISNITYNTSLITVLIFFGSSLYLMVRGLSNIVEGKSKSFWIKNEIVEFRNEIEGVSVEDYKKIIMDKRLSLKFFIWLISRSIYNRFYS